MEGLALDNFALDSMAGESMMPLRHTVSGKKGADLQSKPSLLLFDDIREIIAAQNKWISDFLLV